MKALIKTHPGDNATFWVDVDEKQPGPGEVRLDLIAAGLCHTDLGMIHGAYGPGSGYSPTFPLVLGHEFVGRVADCGGEVELPVGSKVVGSAHVTCGRCAWCTRGRSMLCQHLRVLGLDRDGVFAESFVVPARNLALLPDEVSDRLAVLAEPFAVAAHAVDLAGLQPDEDICVVGPGTVGLLTVGALAGHKVTVVGRPGDAKQLDSAAALGAADVASSPSDIEALQGRFDAVFETAGAASAVTTSMRLLGRGGRLVCVGLPAGEARFSSASLAWNEQQIIGSRGYDLSTWTRIPDRLAAAAGLERIVTHSVHLEDHLRAIGLVESRAATKVLLHV